SPVWSRRAPSGASRRRASSRRSAAARTRPRPPRADSRVPFRTMTFVPVGVVLKHEGDGWIATVSVNGTTATVHRVRMSRAEHERYGGGDVSDLVRRSFEFLLARESNT